MENASSFFRMLAPSVHHFRAKAVPVRFIRDELSEIAVCENASKG
jgi:hypothetical protein